MKNITHDYLKQILDYDKLTGNFTWKYRKEYEKSYAKSWNTKYVGMVAGNVLNNGYRVIVINSIDFLAHHLAWLYVKGVMPKYELDHIDRNPSNNAINNLRFATSLQNKYNTKMNSKNTSGFKGVSWSKSANRWIATMSVNNKTKYIGCFDSKEEASIAYIKAISKRSGEFIGITHVCSIAI